MGRPKKIAGPAEGKSAADTKNEGKSAAPPQNPAKKMTPIEMGEMMKQYFDACEAKDVFPDYAGMRLELGLSQDDVENYCRKGNPQYLAYRMLFDRAKDRRESWLVRRSVTDPKTAPGCKVALEQSENGGYGQQSKKSAVVVIHSEQIQGGFKRLSK